ncbi:MAG: NAD-dependent epimerase/dehydratase family protein [Treponema sp.]
MNQTIWLVTGAAGFLGGTICRQLVQRGEKVRALVLRGDKAVQFVPKEVEIIEGDLCDTASLERFFDVPQGKKINVLHIGSIVTVDPEYNQKVMDVNVGGTSNIVNFCLAKRERVKLVYCSSTGTILPLAHHKKIPEPETYNTKGLKDCYSISKSMATQRVLAAAYHDDLNACIVLPSGIMGPEDFAVGHTTKTFLQIVNGEMKTGISGSFNLADVRDLAQGVILAAEKGRQGESYILGNEEVSFKKFAKILQEESGCKPVKNFIPGWLAYFIAWIMEKQAEKTGKKPMMTTFAVWNLCRNNNFDSSKAKAELGYTTRSYKETIRDEFEWCKKAGLIM